MVSPSQRGDLEAIRNACIDIKEGIVAGERHTYVAELILALKGQGWLRNLSSTRSIVILAGGKSFPRRVGVPAPV